MNSLARGRLFVASGTNSDKNSFTGMGPTNLSHASRVISLYSVDLFGGGPDEWASLPRRSCFRGVGLDKTLPLEASCGWGGVLWLDMLSR